MVHFMCIVTTCVVYDCLNIFTITYVRQKWLAVVDLKGDSPKAIRKLNTHGKHEIKAVEWNPHRVNENLIASAVSRALFPVIIMYIGWSV